MRTRLMLLLLVSLLVPLAVASGFSEIEKIPDSYDYRLSPGILFDPDAARLLASELGIPAANFTSQKVLGALNASERESFKKSLSLFNESDLALSLAKERHAQSEIVLLLRMMIAPLNSQEASSNWLVLGMIAAQRETEGIESGISALFSSAAGVNEAIHVLDFEMDELELAGAGFSNYTGAASGAYNGLKEAVAAIKGNETDGSGLGNDYAKALAIAHGVRGKISGKSGGTGNLADEIELLAGSESSIFSKIALMRRNSVAALASMDNEYRTLEGLCEQRIPQVEAEAQRMKKDGYGLIGKELVLEFYGGDYDWGTTGLSPSESIGKAERLAGWRGFERGAKQALADSKDTVKGRQSGYLARGIEKVGECIEKTNEAQNEIARADALVGGLLDRAKALASRKGRDAKGALGAFSPKNEEEKKLYESALAKEAKADKASSEAAAENSGNALLKYSEAIKLYGDAAAMISDQSAYVEGKRGIAKRAVEHLAQAVKNAQKDGIDVSFEKDYAESADVLLSVAKSDLLDSIISSCESYEKGILEKATVRYSGLNELREKITDSFVNGEAPIKELQDDYREFADYESRFAKDGAISPELALGSYYELESFYGGISDRLSQYLAIAVQKSLEKTAEATVIFEEVQELDKAGAVTVEVSLGNELGIGYPGPIAAEVPLGFSVRSSEVSEKSPEIENVAYANGKLLILFKRIDANGRYRVVFEANKTVAETKSSGAEDRFLGGFLYRKITVKFTSSANCIAGHTLELAAMPDRWSAKIGVRTADVQVEPYGDGATASITGEAQTGDNTFSAEFVFKDPVNVKKEELNETAQGENEFSYIVAVDSALDLKSVPVNVPEPALKEGDAKVFGLGGFVPKKQKIEKTGEGGIISWEIDELPAGATARFVITVTVSDEILLAKRLYSETALLFGNFSLSWTEAELSKADELIKTGSYKKAITVLEQAQNRFQGEMLASGKGQEAATAQIFSLFEKISSANRTLAELLAAGYPSADSEMKIAAAEAEYQKAQMLAEEGDYAQAVSAAGAGLKGVSGIDYKAIFKERDAASTALGSAKKDALVLSQLSDTRGILNGIDDSEVALTQAEGKLSSGDYSGAIPLIKKADEGAKSASQGIGKTAENWYSSFKGNFSGYALVLQGAKRSLESLNGALAATETRVPKGGLPELAVSPKEAQKQLDAIEKHLGNLAGKEPNGGGETKFVLENTQNLKIAIEEMAQLEALRSALGAQLTSLGESSARSAEQAGMALDQLVEIRGQEPDIAEEISTLRKYEEDSGKALSEGRLADSLSLSSYVLKRSAYLLKLPKNGDGGVDAVLVGAVSVVLLAAIVALFFLKRKKPEAPKEPKPVPRAKTG